MREASESIPSGGRQVTVECFEPDGAVNAPAIIALHGSGGMSRGAPIVRALIAPIVGMGYAVYLPHYFERTGTERSTPQTSRLHFVDWTKTIGDVLSFAEKRPATDPARIGIIGISLGAFLGLSVATYDPRVKAVVDFFGGLPPPFDRDVGKLPPTLVLHGEDDPIVPVSEARRLAKGLADHGVPFDLQVYPKEGHNFSPLTALDAARRTMGFLGRWL
jgi:carboxymethylenebutenolidase